MLKIILSVNENVIITLQNFAGTLLGLCGMLLYYRFFHPAGPIKPFVGQSVDFVVDPDIKHSPDFVIHDARYSFELIL